LKKEKSEGEGGGGGGAIAGIRAWGGGKKDESRSESHLGTITERWGGNENWVETKKKKKRAPGKGGGVSQYMGSKNDNGTYSSEKPRNRGGGKEIPYSFLLESGHKWDRGGCPTTYQGKGKRHWRRFKKKFVATTLSRPSEKTTEGRNQISQKKSLRKRATKDPTPRIWGDHPGKCEPSESVGRESKNLISLEGDVRKGVHQGNTMNQIG